MTGSRPTEVATRDEIEAMRATLDGRRKDHVRTGAILTALAVGLRRGEVCALDCGDLRIVDGVPVLHVATLKRRKRVARLVPLKPDDAAAIAKYVRQQHGATPDPAAPLFMTAGTRYPFTTARLTARAVICTVQTLRRHAGVERRVTPHSFRHGYATRLMQTGADVRTVQELLGHASIASTQRYLHTTFARQVEAAKRV